MTAISQGDIRSIPLALVTLSETTSQIERRKHLDARAINELAESITSVGLLQPVLARARGASFEIVAGERRVLAARKAGLVEIMATVRDMTDKQVLEVQLVENLQRADLHELAEAEGYEGLMRLGHTAEEIADKVGKSKGYVYARMKLLALAPAARRAFYDGKLTSSTALLLARIPVESLQLQALKEIGPHYADHDGMSAREAARHIHDRYMTRLGGAEFPTGDATLLPSAGACGPCPKRTGNQPGLFEDVKGADVCTDPNCFKAKRLAFAKIRIGRAAQTGQQVISGKEVKKVAPYGTDSSLNGYVRLDSRNYDLAKPKTYRQQLGKNFVPVLLVDPESGGVVEVAPVSAVHTTTKANNSWRSQQAAQDKKAKLESAYRVALFRAWHDSLKSDELDTPEIRTIAFTVFDRLGSDVEKRLYNALQWEVTKRDHGVEFDIEARLAKMKPAELANFLRACLLAHDLYCSGYALKSQPEDLLRAAKAAGIDAKKIRAQLDATEKAKSKKSKPKARK